MWQTWAPMATQAAVGTEEGELQGRDGTRLFYRVSRDPDVTPERLVMLVHGFADHSGRYTALIPRLCRQGAVVYAVDLRGNGRSDGQRGHAMSYRELVDDVAALVDLAVSREPGLERVLFAHSTGAIFGIHYLLESPQAVDRAILSSPCLRLAYAAPAWKTTAGRLMSSLVPRFSMEAGFDPGAVSRDPEVVAANEKDPLVTQAMSSRFYSEVYLKAMPAALASIDRLSVPMLVLVGTGDRLVSPTVADEFERRANAPCAVKTYAGAYHETYNDLDREAVFADVDAWLGAAPSATTR